MNNLHRVFSMIRVPALMILAHKKDIELFSLLKT